MNGFGFMVCLLVLTLGCAWMFSSPELVGTPETGGLVVIAFEVKLHIDEAVYGDDDEDDDEYDAGVVKGVHVRNEETGVITISRAVLFNSLVLLSDMQEGRYRLERIVIGKSPFLSSSYTLDNPVDVTFSVVPGKVTYCGKLLVEGRESSIGSPSDLEGISVYLKAYESNSEIRALKWLLKKYKKKPWGKPIRDRLEELEEAKRHK